MWPKYTRMPIDWPYSSDRKRVISYVDFPWATGPYGFPSLTKKQVKFEAYLYIAPCAEGHCMNYTKTILYNSTSLSSQPSSKLRWKNLPSDWSAVQHDSMKREMLTMRPLSYIYTYSHFSCPVSFLFILQYSLQMHKYQNICSSKVWRRQNNE